MFCVDLQRTQAICPVMEKKKADGKTVGFIVSVQFIKEIVNVTRCIGHIVEQVIRIQTFNETRAL